MAPITSAGTAHAWKERNLPGPLVAQRNISVTTITALHDDHCFPNTAPSERSAVHPKLGAAAMGGPIFFREVRCSNSKAVGGTQPTALPCPPYVLCLGQHRAGVERAVK